MGDGESSFDQKNQNIEGQQVNIGRVDQIGHVGDVVHGDVVYGDKVIKRSELEELRDYVRTAVATYTARMNQAVLQGYQNPEEPYKSLYAFDIEDANIFFGRDGAVESLYETVLKDRLTVVYARSGAGKTSLLNAGLTPRLITDGRLPVFARTYHDPVYALKQAVAPKSAGLWPALLGELSLHDFLGEVCRNLGSDYQELVIVLDQFEEFFVFWPEAEREDFVHALADCYDDEVLPVRFIIALRQEYFTQLDVFETRVKTALDNRFGLKAMSWEEAQLAITGPVGRLRRDVSFEQDLLAALLEDLASGEIELPHLQLVCAQLFESLPADRKEILLEDYEAFGRTAGVLGRYLQETLDGLHHEQGEVATAVLKGLVSSETTKRVMSEADLATRFGEAETVLEHVLVKLINKRLLRRDEVAGEIVYELAHEVLIEEIRGWFDETDLRHKQSEEMLARDVANWRIDRTPIPKARLERLYKHRETLEGLDSETAACLLHSAVAAKFQVEGWAIIAANISAPQLRDVLQKASSQTAHAVFRGLGFSWQFPKLAELGQRDKKTRIRAAGALGQLGDERAVEPLSAALKDEDRVVRREAAKALGPLGDERTVEPLSAALKDEDQVVRREAAGALGQLGDARAVEPLIAALKDEIPKVRSVAAGALGFLGNERAVEPLIASLKDKAWDARRGAAGALGHLGDERAVEPLIASLKDKAWDVRRGAAGALGQLGDARAVKPLSAALKDENWDVRRGAAKALGSLGERAVEPLIAALKDEYGDVRGGAAGALGQLGDERAVEPLIAALKDEVWHVRRRAAGALGRLGDERAVEPLIAALKDERWDIRRRAAGALGQLGDERAVEPLIAALQDKDGDVRQWTAESLKKLGWEEESTANN